MKNPFFKITLFCLLVLFPFFINANNEVSSNDEKIKITYYCFEGNNCPEPFEIDTCGEIVNISSVEPFKDNYTFIGWGTDVSSNTVVFKANDEIKLDYNLNLYAIYGKKITITLDATGGTINNNKITAYGNITYPNLPIPKRKGYSFAGWYLPAEIDVLIEPNTVVQTEKNHTLYARWKKTDYTIDYILNGGTITNEKSSYNITTKTFKLINPTKKGYIFKGWYTSKKWTKKITKINKGTTGNKILYAKWEPIKYNIKYVGNGSSSGRTKKVNNLKYNKEYRVQNNWFSKKGYTFVGWSTKKDGTGTIYKNKDSFKNLTSKNGKTITLYAIWKLKNYKITYVLNGGINNESNPNSFTINSEIKLLSPSKKYATFMGWYSDSKYKNRVKKIKSGTTGNKKYYAKWKKMSSKEKHSKLLKDIDGFYWYLDGYEDSYAYIYPYTEEWFDHYALSWNSENMKLENNEFIMSKDTNIKYSNDPEIHNTFLIHYYPEDDTTTLLIDEYNMHVINNKLYITLGDKTYSFTKSFIKKKVIPRVTFDVPNSVNPSEKFNIVINYKPSFEYFYFDILVHPYAYSYRTSSGSVKPFFCDSRVSGSNGAAIANCSVTSGIFKDYGFTSPFSPFISIIERTTETSFKTSVRIEEAIINVNGIELNQHEKEILRGATTKIDYTLYPNDADNKKVYWISSNPNVASVDSTGNIKALSKGTTIITVTTEDGNYSDECEITVENPPLTATADIGMTIISSGGSSYRGISVEINPSGGTGNYTYYSITLYKSDGKLIGTVYEKQLYSTYGNGSYYAEFEVHDSDGNEYRGTSSVVTISGF